MTKLDDPRHLRQLGSLPAPLSRALEQEAQSGPTAAQAARMAAALGITLPPSPAAPPVAPALGSWGAIAIVAGVVSVGSLLAWVGVGTRSEVQAPPSTTPPAPVTVVDPAPLLTQEPLAIAPTALEPVREEPIPSLTPRRAPARPSAPVVSVVAPAAPPTVLSDPPSVDDDAAQLRAENALVQGAEGALAHDPPSALRIADQHRARFPTGILAEEREVIAIDALLRMGRRSEAESRARVFTTSHTGSVHARRIARLLARP